MNRYQQAVIDYSLAENRLLKEQLEGRRVRLTDQQRRRLAAKAHDLGHVPQGPPGTTLGDETFVTQIEFKEHL